MKSSSSISPISQKSRASRTSMSETHCLSLRAQPLDKLDCGIGVCRQAQFRLGRLDAAACGGSELAVDLAHFETAPREELLEFLDLLHAQVRNWPAAPAHGRRPGQAGGQVG